MRRVDSGLFGLLTVLIIALAIGWWRFANLGAGITADNEAENLAEVMGPTDDANAFARVTGPAPLVFPKDHGAHPDYRTEWWYFTGNLRAADGHEYGFQLTLFRSALAPAKPERASAWATRQAWMGHFAITDISGQAHRAAERYQRGALGLAGARVNPVRVWLDDWEIESHSNAGLFPLNLSARDPEQAIAITLAITADKPHVLQGDAGYSRKGADPANASRYYSYTRLAAKGSLEFGAATASVTGSAWLDREWSTSALDANQQGWDWFALQLEDGRDVMVYRLRRRNGQTDPNSAGVVVSREGEGRVLSAEDFTLTPNAYWQSPETGSRYPIVWTLRLPIANLELKISARVEAQEMPTTVRYWEGAVSVTGTAEGVGYLEMTGY
ncbi:MAG: lipocalin-like domain-containing protein [Spiribacter sp.]|jgi:predicted secreted hydrolase|nr:lipocalin-like domain-containing protein [Spiribacter sp.]